MQITADNIWFSPINVLHHFAELDVNSSVEFKKTKVFKKAYEANLTAIMLMGIIKEQGQEYWLQITKDEEGTPDIRTFRYAKRGKIVNWQEIQEVEVIQYEYHSEESITDFLKTKKLPPHKFYPSTTTILCLADKITTLPSWKKQYEELKDNPAKNSIIILAKTHPTKTIYTICQIHPQIDLYSEFDITEEAYSRKYKGVLIVSLNPKGELTFSYNANEKHYPFETLGLKPPYKI